MIGSGPIGASAIGSAGAQAGGTTTTLTAAAGSFSLTGVAASSVRTYRLPAAVGDFALTGQAAQLSSTKTALPGDFALTGQDAAFRINHRLSAAAGAVALTGQDASVQYIHGIQLSAAAGAFTLTGKSAIPARNSTVDPYRNLVVYLHHCDNRTESIYSEDVIPIGNATVSSSISKFGTGSYALDGSGDYFYSLNRLGFAFSTAPFTMEMWVRFNAAQTDATFMKQMGGWKFGLVSGQLGFWANNLDVASNTGAFTPTPGQWYSVAVDRDASNVLRIYVDGVMLSKTTGYSTVVGGSSASLWFGNGDSYLNGYIDEIRLTNGVARYASDGGYTPATLPFSYARLSASAGSVALTGNAASYYLSPPFILARTGAFTFTGGEARFRPLDAGSFALTGKSASLIYRIPTRLSAAAGAVALTGVSAALDKRKAILGARATYTLTGGAAQFRHNQYLPVAAASYTFTGAAAQPFKRSKLFPAAAAFALSGQAALFRRNRGFSAGPGAFALTGQNADRITARKVFPDPGAFALAGGATGALYNQRLSATTAAFAATFLPAHPLRTYRIAANSAQFDETGQAAGLFRGKLLAASAASLAWAGVAAKKSIARTGKSGRFSLAGQGADLWAGWGGDAVGVVSSPVATAGVAAQGTAQGNVTAPRAQAAWSDR